MVVLEIVRLDYSMVAGRAQADRPTLAPVGLMPLDLLLQDQVLELGRKQLRRMRHYLLNMLGPEEHPRLLVGRRVLREGCRPSPFLSSRYVRRLSSLSYDIYYFA